jgi:hypothetical protein
MQKTINPFNRMQFDDYWQIRLALKASMKDKIETLELAIKLDMNSVAEFTLKDIEVIQELLIKLEEDN